MGVGSGLVSVIAFYYSGPPAPDPISYVFIKSEVDRSITAALRDGRAGGGGHFNAGIPSVKVDLLPPYLSVSILAKDALRPPYRLLDA